MKKHRVRMFSHCQGEKFNPTGGPGPRGLGQGAWAERLGPGGLGRVAWASAKRPGPGGLDWGAWALCGSIGHLQVQGPKRDIFLGYYYILYKKLMRRRTRKQRKRRRNEKDINSHPCVIWSSVPIAPSFVYCCCLE